MKAVIFDLDGTLLDRDESVLRFIRDQYKRLNNYLNHIPIEIFISRFIQLDNHGYVWKDKVYAQLVQEYNINGLTSEDLLQDYLKNFKKSAVPFNGLIDMLEKLKEQNFLLGIITNGYGQFQMDNIEALTIKHFFDVILVSEWEGLRKPDPAIFQRALKKLKVDPSESVYIGDHPENDIVSAQKVGMRTIWKRTESWKKAEAKFIVDELKEIPNLLAKLN